MVNESEKVCCTSNFLENKLYSYIQDDIAQVVIKLRKVSDPKFNKTPAKAFTSPAKKKIDTSWAVIKTMSLKLRHALRAGEVKRFQVSPCKSQEPISSGDPGRRGGKGEKGKTIDF